ncbi:MAG TPA: hypothetical protein VFG72_08165 [Marmoricola sp.]|nr:hypothetical protein [Marmoricola sp.]
MDTATALALTRIALGGAAWVAPGLTLKGMLLDTTAPQAPFLVRLFGARDVALGVVTLLVGPESRPALLKVGVAVDGSDAVSAVLALRAGALRPLPVALIAMSAGSAVVSGVIALRQTSRPG